MIVHFMQYIFTIHVCLQETAFLQYNESRFMKFHDCLNICVATGLNCYLDIMKDLIKWTIINPWQSFMYSFMLISIYACLNRTSDAWLNITSIYETTRLDLKEALTEIWVSSKTAILSITKVLTIVKIIELLVIAFMLMGVPGAAKLILKTIEKL